MKPGENQEVKVEEQQSSPQGYAVRPRHRQRRLISYTKEDSMFKVRNILNIVFMLLAIGGVCLYMFTEWHTAAYVVLLVGVVMKIAEVAIRLFHK